VEKEKENQELKKKSLEFWKADEIMEKPEKKTLYLKPFQKFQPRNGTPSIS
jgi:hypothetical protein